MKGRVGMGSALRATVTRANGKVENLGNLCNRRLRRNLKILSWVLVVGVIAWAVKSVFA